MTVSETIERMTGLRRLQGWLIRRGVDGDSIINAITAVINLVLGFAFARAGVFGGFKPFGAGITAAAGGGMNGITVLIGVMLGHISSDPFDWAMKYISISVLIFAAESIVREADFSRARWFPPVTAAIFTAGIGFVYISDSGWQYKTVLLQTIEVLLAAASAGFFANAFLPKREKEQMTDTATAVCVVALLAVVCIALENILIFKLISVGRIVAVLFLMLAAFKCGGSIGCTLGLALGFAMDAGVGIGSFYTLTMGASGLIAGFAGKRSKLGSAIVFEAMGMVFVLLMEESAAILYEGFIAGVIFMVLPDFMAARVRALFPLQVSSCGVIKAREYTRVRVEQMSMAFEELYDSVQIGSAIEQPNETGKIFDRVTDSICRSCPDMERCWETESERTIGVFKNIAPRMMSQGSVVVKDFPLSFRERCGFIDELTRTINQELRVMLYRRQYKNKLREKRGAVYNQYADISSVLKSLAGELGSELTFEPELERKLKKYLAGLNIEANAAVFRERGGRLRAEIYGDGILKLCNDREYLEKLSAVLGTRLCTGGRLKYDNKMLLLEAEPLAVSVGIAAVKKKGQSVSGDRGTYFKTDDGVLNILLSDGMGTGSEAARCSESTIRILERFLRAGVTPETALKILNDLMLLKNDNDTVCATVDLMCVDMFSGETRLYKFGAAPTYVRKGSIVKRLTGKSLSAGLGYAPGEEPDFVEMKLEPNTFAVIASDGVCGGDDDSWLRISVANYEGKNPKELAKVLLQQATTRSGCEDDMTVLVLFMEDRP